MGYAVVRQGSYSLQDPSRKGGSDVGHNPKKSGWVVEYGGLYFFKHHQYHVDGKYYDPGAYVLVQKLGVPSHFPKGRLMQETLDRICIWGEQPLPPFTKESYILAVG